MSPIVFIFLAFSVTLATVTCLSINHTLPQGVNSLQKECEDRQHSGLCVNFYRNGIWPRCDKFACATGLSRGFLKEAVIIDEAPNGLKCGPSQVCYDGVCDDLQLGESMPIQGPTDILKLYQCFIRNSTHHSRINANNK